MSIGAYTRLHTVWHNDTEAHDTPLEKTVFSHVEDALTDLYAGLDAVQTSAGAVSGLATLGSDGILTAAQRPPSSGGSGGVPLMSPLGFLLGGN